jgi:hypothetical protein
MVPKTRQIGLLSPLRRFPVPLLLTGHFLLALGLLAVEKWLEEHDLGGVGPPGHER